MRPGRLGVGRFDYCVSKVGCSLKAQIKRALRYMPGYTPAIDGYLMVVYLRDMHLIGVCLTETPAYQAKLFSRRVESAGAIAGWPPATQVSRRWRGFESTASCKAWLLWFSLRQGVCGGSRQACIDPNGLVHRM
jgi:hypothetical protein